MRQRIEANATTFDLITLMSEGNPGALSVLMQLIKASDVGFMHVLSLDDMNIRGSAIWVGYKDHCGQNLNKFAECIKERNEDMVATINDEIERGGCGESAETAVTSGASFTR